MKAATPAAAFRLRRARGFLTMAELVSFAEHVARVMGHEVVMEGVESARPLNDGSVAIAALPLTEGDAPPSMNVNKTPRPRYTFPRSAGLAVWQHLAAYHEFIWPQVTSFKLTGDRIKQSRSLGSAQQVEINNAL